MRSKAATAFAAVDEDAGHGELIVLRHGVELRIAGLAARGEPLALRELGERTEDVLVGGAMSVEQTVRDAEPGAAHLARVLERARRLRPQRIGAAVPEPPPVVRPPARVRACSPRTRPRRGQWEDRRRRRAPARDTSRRQWDGFRPGRRRRRATCRAPPRRRRRRGRSSDRAAAARRCACPKGRPSLPARSARPRAARARSLSPAPSGRATIVRDLFDRVACRELGSRGRRRRASTADRRGTPRATPAGSGACRRCRCRRRVRRDPASTDGPDTMPTDRRRSSGRCRRRRRARRPSPASSPSGASVAA